MMTPALIIFDLDDTLAATSVLWKEAETQLLDYLGGTWSEELALHYKGMNALDVAAIIHRLMNAQVPVEDCQALMRKALFEAFENTPPSSMPGAVGCVQRLATVARLTVASGSPLSLIEGTLGHLGICDAFCSLITSESVPRGKPFPDVFLAAAEENGVSPDQCVVIEDSLPGVLAAKAAGMACLAVPSSRADDIRKEADRLFTSLDDIGADDVFQLP